MSTAPAEVQVQTVGSCSHVRDEHRGHVVVSGSYGGNYNAYNAARHQVRAVIMSDAGRGKDDAGIRGLAYLDRIGLAAATADAMTCHIGDGADILAHGVISHVNQTAASLGCAPGQSVWDCAERLRSAQLAHAAPPPISDGNRVTVRDNQGEPKVVCADSVGMIKPEDAGQIVVTASHAALFPRPADNEIAPVHAVFFSDACGGKDGAGFARLADLDRRQIAAATVSADSAPIGDARAIYQDGIISHVNPMAARAGAQVGTHLKDFIAQLIAQAATKA
jgi:hypothetical protein